MVMSFRGFLTEESLTAPKPIDFVSIDPEEVRAAQEQPGKTFRVRLSNGAECDGKFENNLLVLSIPISGTVHYAPPIGGDNGR